MSKLTPGGGGGDSQNSGSPVWMQYLGKGAGVLGGGGNYLNEGKNYPHYKKLKHSVNQSFSFKKV